MRVSVHWGIEEEPEQMGRIVQGNLEDSMVLIEFSPGDRSWFTQHGGLWYEDEVGVLSPDPVSIQQTLPERYTPRWLEMVTEFMRRHPKMASRADNRAHNRTIKRTSDPQTFQREDYFLLCAEDAKR